MQVEAQDSGYWVRAEVDNSRNAGESFGAILKRTFRSLVQSDEQPSSETIELRYSAEEIQKLVQNGLAQRHDASATPDPFSLSHILRMAGAYVDGLDQATLIRATLEDRWITIRYKDGNNLRDVVD